MVAAYSSFAWTSLSLAVPYKTAFSCKESRFAVSYQTADACAASFHLPGTFWRDKYRGMVAFWQAHCLSK